MNDARDIFIDRIKREIIGPGSDIFLCSEDFSDEVIEGKPLIRYYSGILFPPKTEIIEDNSDLFSENVDEMNLEPNEFINEGNDEQADNHERILAEDEEETFKLTANLYFPTNIGLTLCVPQEINQLNVILNFGTYKKATSKLIKVKYNGEGIELLSRFGLQEYFEFDNEKRVLCLKKELKGNRRKNQKSEDYLKLDSALNKFASEISYDHNLLKHLKKLIYGKDKWLRVAHNYSIKVGISENDTYKLKNCIDDTSKLPNNVAEGVKLYIKIFEDKNKKFVKILLENKTSGIKAKQFLPSNEKLNESCLFQIEFAVRSANLLPFDKRSENEFLSEEDKTLNFLYENVKSYGIGHGTACEWELKEKEDPTWIKTTFFPHHDIKSQSTKLDIEDNEIEKILNIKNLSSFSDLSRNDLSNGLQRFSESYNVWIDKKSKENENKMNIEIGHSNLNKCTSINQRIRNGIDILRNNHEAFRAFQLANSAMYMQMFHSARYFSNENNKGFELYEWNERFQNGRIPEYDDYKSLNYPSTEFPKWRPFQIGFILLSLESLVDPSSDDRKLVDLIWFPTGGGKTEAYLAATAFLIFYRRLTNKSKAGGVNAIIRYTLRLLTAQQFERATKVILACEKVRKGNIIELGNEEISIGFWVGVSTIPNKTVKAIDTLNRILEMLNRGERTNNIFQVNTCQWCNTKTITKVKKDDSNYIFSIRANYLNQGIKVYCPNSKCDFSKQNGGFPMVLVDEDIYKKPPTLLFGTIDKFAMLAWRDEGRKLFNQQNDYLPPELIIQDELHLISGPLGSIAGLYENVIQSLCEKKGISPKIIASTATTKNAENQVKKLYGKEISIFPPFALDTKDNFFSQTEEKSLRRYIGIMPTGKNFTMTQLKMLAVLLYARLDVWQNSNERIKESSDNFWTIISYFNSLKDVGKMANKIGSDLRDNTLKQLHNRLLNSTVANYRRLKFAQELTSRITSERIKDTLDRLNIQFENDIENTKAVDLVLATNMISVGLDVQRLGVMLVNGMPRNIAEYIQSTSRVARKNHGVVFTLFNPDNSRDLSYFEHFVSFHQKFYKEIEPLSLTPFTENTLDKMLFTSVVTYFRHKLGNNSNDAVMRIKKDILLKEFEELLFEHGGISENEKGDFLEKLEILLNYWEDKIKVATDEGYNLKFKSNKREEKFLKTYDQKMNSDDLITMQSVRNVEPSAKIKINQY